MPETNDLGFTRGEGEKTRAIATDEDGRMRLLNRQRRDGVPGHPIMATGETILFAFEQSLDDGDRFGQPLDPGASSIEA